MELRLESAQRAPEENRHHHRGQRETHGDVQEDGNVGERVFHHDERGAPDERRKSQSEIGAEMFAEHGRKSLCAACGGDKTRNHAATACARLIDARGDAIVQKVLPMTRPLTAVVLTFLGLAIRIGHSLLPGRCETRNVV